MIRANLRNQKGIALISAMLIVALVTVIAVSLSYDQSIAVRKASFALTQTQKIQLIFGLEDWAMTILQKDLKDSKTDHPGEDWAKQIPTIPVDRGFFTGGMEDEQAKYNLNSLVDSPSQLTRFKQLCDNLDIDKEFILALLDWLDDDVNIRYPDGAEDDYYSSLNPAYRPANRLMHHVSEFKLVKGVSDEIYSGLLPFITVLPTITDINVNSLSQEVFLSLDKTLTEKQYDTYVEELGDDGFSSVKDLVKKVKINIVEDDLSVSTQYFLMNGIISIDDSEIGFDTLVHREKNGIKKISRTIK